MTNYFVKDLFVEDLEGILSLDSYAEQIGLNKTPSVPLDVNGMISATSLQVQSNASIATITNDLIVSSNILASNATFISTYASNLDMTNLSIQGAPIGSTCPNSNGEIDFSWLTADPLSNVVWKDHWANVGKTAGAIAGAIESATLETSILDDPLLSPQGITAFDAQEALTGTASTEGYELAVATLTPLGAWMANMIGSKIAGGAAHEVSYLTASDDTEADSIGVAAGTAAVIAELNGVPGINTQILPVIGGLGTLVGNISGNTLNIASTKATVIDHTAQLETLTTDVSALDDLTATHTADLAALDTTVTAHTADLVAVDTSITAIEAELTSTTDTANSAQSTALWDSNNFSNYLPLSGGTMTGLLTAYSNIKMATPMMLTASNSTNQANLYIDPSYLRYINQNGIQFSVNSNGMFPLSTPFIRILGNNENNGGYSNFGRIDMSWVNGFDIGCGLCNNAPNGHEWFNVSPKSEISLFANDVGYMSKITNSNAEVSMGGFTMKKDGSVNDTNGYVIFDTGGTFRRKGSNVSGSTGFTVSPSGYVSAGAGLTIDPYGNVVCSNLTASNITAVNLTTTTIFETSIYSSNATFNYAKLSDPPEQDCWASNCWFIWSVVNSNLGSNFNSSNSTWSNVWNSYNTSNTVQSSNSMTMYGTQASNNYVFSNMNIGINQPTPQATLDVNGSINALNLYEGSTILSTKYSLSNTQSNYHLTSAFNTYSNFAGAQYAPSNALSNYHLTSAFSTYSNFANTQYAPSNTLSNYTLTSTANTQYAPSNTLSNYTLTSTANTQYAPSNTLSNYHLTSTFNTYSNFANTQFAPSNTLSNYHLTSAFNTYSNWAGTSYLLSNVGSNFYTISNQTAFSNWSVSNYLWNSNTLSNYQALINFNTYSNWVDTKYSQSNTLASLSNYAYNLSTSNSTITNIYTCNVNAGSGFFSSALQCAGIAMSAAGLAFDAVSYFDTNGKLLSAMQNVAGDLIIDPVNKFIKARQGYFGMGTITINSNDQIVWTQCNTSNMWLTSNSLNVVNSAPFTFNASNFIFTSNLTVSSNIYIGSNNTNALYSLSNTASNYMKNAGGYFTGNIAFGSNTYSAAGQDALHVFVPQNGAYSSNDFAITSGWGGYYDMCGIAWNATNTANNYYGRYNNTRLGWSLLTASGGGTLNFSCYGAGYTGSNIPQGVSFTPLQINSNFVNISTLGVNKSPAYPLDVNGTANATSLSENGVLIATKYLLSNVASNYVLTTIANSAYAPSNVLSNYVLTTTANSTYAPSNTLSNYQLTSAFTTYSNWVNTQYAPSNVLSNYALNSSSNSTYAPSNVLSNYVLTTTANSTYAPSNTLSNYQLTSAFNTYSNWAGTSYLLSNVGSNFYTISNFVGFSNVSTSNYMWSSNSLSNYHLLSAFNTYSNFNQTQFTTLSNYAYSQSNSNVTIYANNISAASGTIGALAMGGAGLALGGYNLFNNSGQLSGALKDVATSGASFTLDPTAGLVNAITGKFNYARFGTTSISLSNDLLIYTTGTASNMSLSSNSLSVLNATSNFTFYTSNVICASNLSASNIFVGGSNINSLYSFSNTQSNYHTISSFNSYSNWVNTAYSPSNYIAYNWNSTLCGTYYNPPAGSNYWYKLGTLSTTSDSANASMMEVRGVIGQFNSYQTALLDVAIGTRGGLNVVGSLKTNSATTNISVYCDLALYMESNSTYTLYLKTTGFYKFDVSVKGTGQGLSVFQPSNGAITASNFPSGSNVFYSIIPYLQQITVGGNFGILNSNPQYNLDVAGQGNATTLSESGTLISTKYAPSNALSNYVLTSTANSTYPSGWTTGSGKTTTSCNVGIGTTAPSYPLDVSGTVRFTGTQLYLNNGNYFIDNSTSGGGQTIMGYNTAKPTAQQSVFQIYNNSTDRTLLFSANSAGTGGGVNGIGIMTGSPAYPLDVNGQVRGNVMISQTTSSGTGALKVSTTTNSTDNWWIGFAQGGYTDAVDRARIGVNIKAGGAGQLFFTTGYGGAQTEQMRIMDTGLVGIGTTNPAYTLDVNGPVHTNTNIIADWGTNFTQLWNDGAVMFKTGNYLRFGSVDTVNTAVNWNEKMRIHTNGYVGIASGSPAYPLDVNGQANATSMSEAGTLLSSKYVLSNTLSNYETASAFTAFSNWISPLAGTGSNAGYGTIGTASIGNCGCNNYASFSYCNMNNSNNCALLQDSLGNTTISCSSNTSAYVYQNITLKQGQTNLAQFNTTSNYFFTPTSFCAPVNFNYSWNSNNPICLDLGLDNYSSLRIGAASFINPFGQIILCQSGGYYSHNIATRHTSVDTTGTGNAIDFNIWSCNLGASATATYCSMSITACNVGINNKNPNTAYKLDVNGSVNINSNLNVVGNTNNYGYLFAGHNNGGGNAAGGGYVVAGNTFDTAGTTHTVNPLASGSSDNSSGICVIVAKNSSTSSPKNGVMMLSWVKYSGSAQLQPSVFHTNTQGMSVFGASNNGANTITVYTDSGCSITCQTFAGC